LQAFGGLAKEVEGGKRVNALDHQEFPKVSDVQSKLELLSFNNSLF
jgi:hypothetical protein